MKHPGRRHFRQTILKTICKNPFFRKFTRRFLASMREVFRILNHGYREVR
ncbi:hypothetical protein [uncultured Merdimonas sp.]